MRKPDHPPAVKTSVYAPKKLTPAGLAGMVALITLETTAVVLISTGKTADGRPPYNTSSIVLIVEFMKLAVSLFGLWYAGQQTALVQHGSSSEVTGEELGLRELQRVSLASLARYCIPSLLYAINNNIFLFILTRMSPAYFQLLLNARVVLTGLAFRWFMGRQLTQRQWLASFTLLFGCVLSQLGTASSSSAPADGQTSVSFSGLILTGVYCFISVSASVYNELLMKTEPSLHVANIQLYSCGVAFNVVGLLFQAQSSGAGFWQGWHLSRTWVIAGTQVAVGLLISRVMKSFDSIMKIFCVACSNLMVYGYSVTAGVEPFTLQFVTAFAIVTSSGYMYSTPAAVPAGTTSDAQK